MQLFDMSPPPPCDPYRPPNLLVLIKVPCFVACGVCCFSEGYVFFVKKCTST